MSQRAPKPEPPTATRPDLSTWLAPITVTCALLMAGCTTITGIQETATVDGPRLAGSRTATHDMRQMLEEYYGGPEVLIETWLGRTGEPGIEAGLDTLADKLARSIVWREPFVIGTVGSSVTAAHANCHDDSYQHQLERLLGPVLAAAGVPFEVRNAGQGGGCGDSFQNQIWCLSTLAGPELDVLHYSWTYFEAGGGAEPFHEMFYRWSLLGDQAAIPQLIYTNDCSRLSALDRELLALYAPFGADALCMERGISAHGYPGKKWGVVGDSLHDTTRDGERPGTSEERRNSLGVVFRDWHPGPLLFQTTADALAYRYSEALLRALDWIESSPDPKQRWPRRRTFDRTLLPTPRVCDPEICDAAKLPKCLVYGDPVLGRQQVERLTNGDPGNPLADPEDHEVAVWQMWREPAPRNLVPEAERARPECQHPTACAGLRVPAGAETGWLTFRLPELEVGFVAVCCSGKRCGQALLDAGGEIMLDGRATEPEVLWGSSKCVQVQPRFESGEGPRTVHVGIRFPPADGPSPAITHVIGL